MAVSEQGKRSVIYGRRDSPRTELRSTARPEPDNNSYLETDVVNKFASRQSDTFTEKDGQGLCVIGEMKADLSCLAVNWNRRQQWRYKLKPISVLSKGYVTRSEYMVRATK